MLHRQISRQISNSVVVWMQLSRQPVSSFHLNFARSVQLRVLELSGTSRLASRLVYVPRASLGQFAQKSQLRCHVCHSSTYPACHVLLLRRTLKLAQEHFLVVVPSTSNNRKLTYVLARSLQRCISLSSLDNLSCFMCAERQHQKTLQELTARTQTG